MSVYDLNKARKPLRESRKAAEPANLYDLEGMHAALRARRTPARSSGPSASSLAPRAGLYDAGADGLGAAIRKARKPGAR